MNPNDPKQNIAQKMKSPSLLQGLKWAMPQPWQDQIDSVGNAINKGGQAVGDFAQGLKSKIASKMGMKSEAQSVQNPQTQSVPQAYQQLSPPPPAPEGSTFAPTSTNYNFKVTGPNGNSRFVSYQNVPQTNEDLTRYMRAAQVYRQKGPVMLKPGQSYYNDFNDKQARIVGNPSHPDGTLPFEIFSPEQGLMGTKARSQTLPISMETRQAAYLTYPEDYTDPYGNTYKKGDYVNPDLKAWIDFIDNNLGSAESLTSTYNE